MINRFGQMVWSSPNGIDVQGTTIVIKNQLMKAGNSFRLCPGTFNILNMLRVFVFMEDKLTNGKHTSGRIRANAEKEPSVSNNVCTVILSFIGESTLKINCNKEKGTRRCENS